MFLSKAQKLKNNNDQTMERTLSNVYSLSETLEKNTKLYFLFCAISAIFIHVTLRENPADPLLKLWFLAVEGNAILFTIYCYKKKGHRFTKNLFFICGLIINALCWGILGHIVLQPESTNTLILVVMVSSAIVILGVPLCHFSKLLVSLYSSIVLLPLTFYFFIQHDTISIALGIAIFSLVPASIIAVKIGHNYKSISDLLERKNQRLIDQLNLAIEEKEVVNKELVSEINEKKKTAVELIKSIDIAEDAVKVKSEFLASMSHEIRTPMNGVIGMAELLLSTNLDNKQQRFTETICKSGKSLLSIINDILDFSKIEAGKMELNDSVFDLRQLIEDLGTSFAEQAHRKGLELNYDYPVDGHSTFRGDDKRIRQILVNLVGNAIKFTEQGDIFIKIELSEQGKENFKVRFSVQDSGIGIDKEAQSKIFGSFSQADGSTTRRFGGTGLGLSISKKLCEIMGGKLKIVSQPEIGSIFSFSIPLKKEMSLKPLFSKIVDRRLKKVRLLIIDTNKKRCRTLEQYFSNWKITHSSTNSSQEAQRLMLAAEKNGEPFHIAIVNANIEGLDSFNQLTNKEFKNIESSIRFILMKDIGEQEDTDQWLFSNSCNYINKPIHQKELYDVLRASLFSESSGLELTETNMSHTTLSVTEQFTLQGHLLIAEDNCVNQELVREMVTNLGCTVDIVDNGQEAIEAIIDLSADSPSPYELLLMDCQMPVMDGFEATQKIRQWESQQSNLHKLPIVALTANAMKGDREKCLNAGMDDYMSKPFNIEQLGAMLHRWLPLYQLDEEAINIDVDADETSDQKTFEVETASQLDIAALDKIRTLQRSGQPNVVIKVIQLFLDNSHKIVRTLEDAVSNGDHKALSRAAYNLQSSCNTVGATNLAKTCAELQILGQEQNIELAQARLAFFEDQYDTLREALEKQIILEKCP